MQLKQIQPVVAGGGLLAAAALSLLGPAPGKAEAVSRQPGSWTMEQATLVYKEVDQVQVIEPVLRLKRQLAGEREIALRFGFDAMSGASPNGGTSSNVRQTFTSPSGNSYSAQPGELPRRTFHDERFSGGIEYTMPLRPLLKLTSGANFSVETDYLSLGLSSSIAWELNQRHTTLNAGLSLNQDTVSPEGGLPVGLEHVSQREENSESDSKTLVDGLIGVTQVMNERWLLQVNLGMGHDSGYMTEPYKGVSVLDADGVPETEPGGDPLMLNERRPDSRSRNTLLVRNMLHLGRDVLHVAWRMYHDDWGVDSHSLDLKYWLKPDSFFGRHDWSFRPHIRWATQTAADFYQPWLGSDEYADYTPASSLDLSSDHRLGEMESLTAGLRVDFPETALGRFWLKPEYMVQRWALNEPIPAGLGSSDPIPDLKVMMVTLGFSKSF
jgi:hypothetical protein